jgi:hypothetical protein
LLAELEKRISMKGMVPIGADVQLLDVLWQGEEPPPCLKPSVLRVNGTDVGLIAKGGIDINAGGPENATTLTVTFMPRSITIGTPIS